jgi:hypothetical protein
LVTTFKAIKVGKTTNFFPLLPFVVVGSEIQDGKKSKSWIWNKQPRSATLRIINKGGGGAGDHGPLKSGVGFLQ